MSTHEKFGNRLLTDDADVFEHNAWDNVMPDEESQARAAAIAAEHAASPLSEERRAELEANAAGNWDSFYSTHANLFFKDRRWLFTEFPELGNPAALAEKVPFAQTGETKEGEEEGGGGDDSEAGPSSTTVSARGTDEEQSESNAYAALRIPSADSFQILEIGCGAGNTVYPLLRANKTAARPVFVFASDYSHIAVRLVQRNPAYASSPCRAFVWDITQAPECVPSFPVPSASLDAITAIFVLSALDPQHIPSVLTRLASLLKKGGTLYFRDYGRHDLAQLRFKQNRCISDNFYVRGDGTRVYFFEKDEIALHAINAGFSVVENRSDRRLIVNRAKRITMHRHWLQAKFVKT